MTEEYAASRYEEACALLPLRLRTAALLLPLRRKAQVEEIRLRIGRQVYLSLPDGEEPLTGTTVTRSDLEQTLDKAAEYAAAETIRHGYVTAAGGFRVGLCGTALPGGAGNEGVRDVSSLAVRIPRVREGAALPLLPQLLEEGRLSSTLVLSPPGGGKTTLLRDLVRLLSQGTEYNSPCRVAAAGCGAALLATVHAASLDELKTRPVGRALLACGVFRQAVLIEGRGSGRKSRVEQLT